MGDMSKTIAAHYPPSEHVPKKQKAASLADFDQAISWKEPSSLNDAEFLEVDDDSANESLIVSSSFDRLVPATSLVRNDDLLPSDHQIKATGTSDLEDVQMHPSLTHYLAERFEAIKHLFAFAWQSVNADISAHSVVRVEYQPWQYAPDPYLALIKGPLHDPYQTRDIFIWAPDQYSIQGKYFVCTSKVCPGFLVPSGVDEWVPPTRVELGNKECYLVARVYRCSSCSSICAGSDPALLASLPTPVQLSFPFKLVKKYGAQRLKRKCLNCGTTDCLGGSSRGARGINCLRGRADIRRDPNHNTCGKLCSKGTFGNEPRCNSGKVNACISMGTHLADLAAVGL